MPFTRISQRPDRWHELVLLLGHQLSPPPGKVSVRQLLHARGSLARDRDLTARKWWIIQLQHLFFFLFFKNLQYCIGFAIYQHESATGVHMCQILNPPSFLPPHTIPLGYPSAPAPSILYPAWNLDWRFVSYMILYMFQCHSPKSSHPRPLESKRLFYTSASLLLSCIQGYHYHLSKFHIYVLVYYIGVFFLAYFTLYNRLQFHPPH